MEDTNKKKWLTQLVVIGSIVGSMSLLGYLSIRFLPSSGTAPYSGTSQQSSHQATPIQNAPTNWADDTGALTKQPVRIKHILHRDVQKRIGRSMVTYRGKMPEAKIQLDVVVLDLDPDATYSRSIDILRGKKGFHVGDERLEIIKAHKLRLQVWHYN